jgi:hypothetical protein
MEELRKFEGLSLEELEAQQVELLPDREEMQTFGDVTFGGISTGDQLASATATATATTTATATATIFQVQGIQALIVS